MVLVLFLMAAWITAAVLKVWPLAVLVDSGFGDRPVPVWVRLLAGEGDRGAVLGWLAAAVLVLHLAQGGLAVAQHRVAMQIALNAVRRARDEVFGCLQRLSMRFLQGARSGDLVRRITADTCAFQGLFQNGLMAAASAVLSLVLMGIILWRTSAVLTLVTMMIVPLLLGTMKYFGPRLSERWEASQQVENQVSSFVQQSIVLLPLTLASGREEHETSAFGARTMAAMQRREAQMGWEFGYWLVVAVVYAVTTAGVAWVGGREIMTGRLSVGEWLVFFAYLPMFYEPLGQLSRTGGVVRQSIDAIQRAFEVMDTAEEVRESSRARPVVVVVRPETDRPPGSATAGIGPGTAEAGAPVSLVGHVEFDRVSLEYQGDVILREVSFRLEAGQSAAILGPSSVGKAALLNLVPRFYDPTSGQVRLENVDVRELRLRDLRAGVAMVPAEPILLPASIAENIAYARTRARRGEVESAARAAHMDQFLGRLPNGYLTQIGEGGIRLSPGERHRLNLARAFLKRAPIVLLEESPALLDAESEHWADMSLGDLLPGRTALIAATRLSTLRRVDRVFVLREGRLTEEDRDTILQRPPPGAGLLRAEPGDPAGTR